MEDILKSWLYGNAKTIAKSYVLAVVPLCKKFMIGKTDWSLEERINWIIVEHKIILKRYISHHQKMGLVKWRPI